MFDLGQALDSQFVWSSTIEVLPWGRLIHTMYLRAEMGDIGDRFVAFFEVD